jgi:hypothetical protein
MRQSHDSLQDAARAAVLGAVGYGPQSIAMLASHMLNAGIPDYSIYLAARMAVNDLLMTRQIEECQIHDGPVVYRLPSKTPMDTT